MKDRLSGFSLLLVDDEPMVLASLRRLFFECDYSVLVAQNALEALELLKSTPVDAALIDLKMPGMDGLALLKKIRKEYPAVMCIMLTGHGGVREAVEAIRLGALDFLEKPYIPDDLFDRVAQLHQVWAWKEEGRKLEAGGKDLNSGFDSLVGNSTAMVELKQMIAKVAPTNAGILITGETGTGKELVARAIHCHSVRAGSPFVPVDCATLNETVIESELFGHVKGAFTGAYISNPGLIASADKGSLFLDEIGELPLSIQAKLLRVLQEREVRPVGSTKSLPVDVRIVAATNRNLEKEVASGGFREDLYYRLNVISIDVPPLRERGADIDLLADFFMKRYGCETAPAPSISPAALECLRSYNWPGNIRELENVIQRAIVLARENTVFVRDLPARIGDCSVEKQESDLSLALTKMADYEKTAIENALRISGNNRRNTAQLLGIGEATLYRKLKKYHLDQ